AHLVALLFTRRVFALRDQRPRFLAPLASIAKADFRIGPDGEQFLPPIDPIFEPPELAARWRDHQEHARAVSQLDRLAARLRVPDCHVCKCHMSPASLRGLVPTKYPQAWGYRIGLWQIPPNHTPSG